MKITKGKVILLLVVIYFAVMGVKSINKEKALHQDILKKVTVVNDGKINPENEGKLVLLTGKINFDKDIIFEELDRPLHTFKAERTVKDFISTEENGKKSYEWKERTEADPNASTILDFVYSTEKYTIPTVGDFTLGEEGTKLVKTTDYYKETEEIAGLKWKGLYYSNPNHEDEEVGDVSIDYNYFNVDKYDHLSVLAKQTGNTFASYKLGKDDIFKVYKGKVDSVEKLQNELDDQVKNDTRGKIYFILMIVGIGVLIIYSSSKNKKKNTTEEQKQP